MRLILSYNGSWNFCNSYILGHILSVVCLNIEHGFAYNVYMIEFLYLIPLPIESVRYRHTVFHKCFIRIMWYNVNLISSSCQTFLLNYNLYMNTYIDAIITYT